MRSFLARHIVHVVIIHINLRRFLQPNNGWRPIHQRLDARQIRPSDATPNGDPLPYGTSKIACQLDVICRFTFPEAQRAINDINTHRFIINTFLLRIRLSRTLKGVQIGNKIEICTSVLWHESHVSTKQKLKKNERLIFK